MSNNLLEYTFIVNPEQRSIISCKVPRPIKIYSYQIDRENVEVFSIGFDGMRLKRVNPSIMTMLLNEPIYTMNDFSFGVYGSKIVMPEIINVRINGKFV